MKTLAERYGLPVQGGIVHTEPMASRLVLELGLADKLKIPEESLSPKKASMQSVFDASDGKYFVAVLRFHGFQKEEDNGYAAIVMSKRLFTQADVFKKVQELAGQMDADLEQLFLVPPDQAQN